MADKAKIKKRLDAAVKKLADIGPDVAEGWGGTILFKCPDLKTGWMMKMSNDGTVESLKEGVDEAAATSIIETDSDTLLGILNGDINASEARSNGKMKAHKALDGLALVLIPIIGPVEDK
jgi:putative sterol carrier protein